LSRRAFSNRPWPSSPEDKVPYNIMLQTFSKSYTMKYEFARTKKSFEICPKEGRWLHPHALKIATFVDSR
jgi:hypothetical protein